MRRFQNKLISNSVASTLKEVGTDLANIYVNSVKHNTIMHIYNQLGGGIDGFWVQMADWTKNLDDINLIKTPVK